MGFWDTMGGAAKWVTDPQQILTAAGFMVGGPVGAGVGRAVGGAVPQHVGPVPWGVLGADTSEFRKSTLADGLQWEDLGQAGKDFASGYSAGKIGQQVPGVKGTEGSLARAFGGGDAMSTVAPPPGGSSAGVPAGDRYWATHADAIPTGVPVGMTEAGGGAAGVGEAYRYFTEGPPTPVFQQTPGGLTQAFTPTSVPDIDFSPGALFEGQKIPFTGGGPSAQQAGIRGLASNAVQKGGEFWGDLSGLEKIYAINALANFGSGLASGPEKMPPPPSSWQTGRPRFAVPTFDQWQSRRMA